MPELPEVEAARAIIAEHCVGRTITDVQAEDDLKVFDGATTEEIVSAFKGRKVLAAGRKGKQMWLTLDGDGKMPLMHFGMTGSVAVRDEPDKTIQIVAYENAPKDSATNWPPRFQKLLLHFGPHPDNPSSQACQLAYCDARRFGRIKLVQGDPAESDAVTKLGFDPLLQMPDLEAFKGLLAKKSKGAARLKPLLLDQSFCAGVGNWVADEVLWQSRLHPEQLLSALQPEHIQALHTALQLVVQTAVAAKADSRRYPQDWMFHVRWGKQAGSLLGHKLDHITVGSRTSCYVPALQKIIGGKGSDADARPAKKTAGSKAGKKTTGAKRKKKQGADSSSTPEVTGDEEEDSPQQNQQQEQPQAGKPQSDSTRTSKGRKAEPAASKRSKNAAAGDGTTAVVGKPANSRRPAQRLQPTRKSGSRTK